MKNIHILPTDKPSRLHYNELDELVFTPKSEQLDGVNIYITSDETAYPYALHLKNQEILKINGVGENSGELYHDKGFSYPKECQKIIITTDQDLIKDGVQAIEYVLYEIIIPKGIGFKVENGKRTETFYQEPKQELSARLKNSLIHIDK